MSLSIDMWTGRAEFSDDGQFRYALSREWSDGIGATLFVMLNPSTADVEVNDPTVRRCCGFARAWGRRSLFVVNLFALRSTDPKALYLHADPTGDPRNLDTILDYATRPDICEVVCAWGRHGALNARGARVLRRLIDAEAAPLALKQSDDGTPWHPLYLPVDTRPTPIRGPLT